jgi:signal peptidase I
MEPNLRVGDHLIVNKMVFSPTASALDRLLLPMRDIRRGEVIVFKYPKDPARDFIKRVVGLPGDRVELRRKKVYVNDQPFDDPFAHYTVPLSPATNLRVDDLKEEYGPVVVPADQYFVMGDNRDNSEDSRFWGFMPASYVKGKALFIYFSVGNSIGDIQWGRLLNRVR